VFLAFRARPGSPHATIAAAVLGLAAGFRPTTVVMFGAVGLVVAARSIRSWRALRVAGAAGAAAALLWLVPMMIEQPGGLGAWMKASHDIFYNAAKSTSLLAGSPEGWTNVQRAGVAATVAAAPAVVVGLAAIIVGLVAARDAHWRRERHIVPVLLAAALPGLVFVALTHFPKAGYAVAFVPPLILLAVLPAARLGTAGRIGVAVVLAAMAAGNVQRFLDAPGVVPLSLVDRHGLWFAERRLGAPFIVTRAEIRRVDALSSRYHRIRGAVDPASEVLVFDLSHSPGNYRYATYALPEYRMYLVGGGINWRSAWQRQQRFTAGHQITVPPGGDAVLTMDEPTSDVNTLIAAHQARPLDVPGGPILIRVRPGATLFGLPVVEGPAEPSTP
jgi:hypothetical protein